MWIRLNQLPYKTEDLVQKMLKGVPADRISAQDSLQHPYFSTLPPPIMHIRDSKYSYAHMLTGRHANRDASTCPVYHICDVRSSKQSSSSSPCSSFSLLLAVSIFKVPGVRLETEVRDVFNPRRRVKHSLLPSTKCW